MGPLHVDLVGFYNVENAKTSNTIEYDLVHLKPNGSPVLRRGTDFLFNVRFTKQYDPHVHGVRVIFKTGREPTLNKGTFVNLLLKPGQELPAETWGLKLERDVYKTVPEEGRGPSRTVPFDLILKVRISPRAPVGLWKCVIRTFDKERKENYVDYLCKDEIYVLFNPWCPEDTVYMKETQNLREYVQNEAGKIWCGTPKRPIGRRWIFGQFDEDVLPSAVFLLDRAGLPHADRANPVLVTRAISAMINANDDDGVLEGRWADSYEGGTAPQAWTGSTLIMQEYHNNGGKPVKYGQCWVFSAVMVTVCRALGIPCRSVTNYTSAHDTDSTLTVDKYFDIFGNKIPNGPDGTCFDSCWNFHCWNDVWMARPDLPGDCGGWQAVDSTPQELSDSRYQCGPASVAAVRRGDVHLKYDGPFVFAEVNADVCHFQEDEGAESGFVRIVLNKYHVGKRIVTKNPDFDDDEGDGDLLDVTASYKNPEGSPEERRAVVNAIRYSGYKSPAYDVPEALVGDVDFDLVEIEAVELGRGFDVVVRVRNNSGEVRTINAAVAADAVYYNGVSKATIKRSPGTFRVGPGDSERLNVHVRADEYLDQLTDHDMIKVYAVAYVKETKQRWSEEDDFALYKPKLTVNVVEPDPRVRKECRVEFGFKNPLNIPLTGCTYTVEGPGIKKMKTVIYQDVGPGSDVSFSESFNAKRPGKKRVLATFNSKQIQGITGSCRFFVNE